MPDIRKIMSYVGHVTKSVVGLIFCCPHLKLKIKRNQKVGKTLIKYNWKCECKRACRTKTVCYKIINQAICIPMIDLARSCAYRVLWWHFFRSFYPNGADKCSSSFSLPFYKVFGWYIHYKKLYGWKKCWLLGHVSHLGQGLEAVALYIINYYWTTRSTGMNITIRT